ncbi:MAG: ATPase [Verrucomicrobia bacterium]|nr:MAG: ATPase [Verrucomicrobiota bacterium]
MSSNHSPTPPPDAERERRALRRSLLRLAPPPAPADVNLKIKQRPCCSPPPVAAGACCGGPKAPAGGACCGSGARRRPDWLLWGSAAFFLLGLAGHFLTGGPGWLHIFGHTCYEMLVRTWWSLGLGIVAVAIIGRVPSELVAALLGRSGTLNGLLRAVAAGVALDLCNHGILMVGMSLYKRGASLGQTVAFLIASPWNSLSLTLILGSLIGWGWMGWFIVLSMVVALITGWITERLVAAGQLPANPNAVILPAGYRKGPALRGVLRSLQPSVENYSRLAMEGLGGSRMVLRWILFGFVLTGLLRALVPETLFQHAFGPTLGGMFLTLVATTLLEVCSEGSSPIAADLLTRAHAPGNAFVFLMAGAATDYTELLSLRATTLSWKASLALPLISTPQVLLIGWLINHYSH